MYSTSALTALYVPGDKPDRFEKATSTGADYVIIDLEDSVTPSCKASARENVREFLQRPAPCPIVIRVNSRGTEWYHSDLESLATCGHVAGVRLPKVETADQVIDVVSRIPDIPIHAVVESALGVMNLFSIACAPSVASVGLGEADLCSELAISDPDGLDWTRARLVVAARAAGLPAPMMSAWTALDDQSGLRDSCLRGKSRGFFGRTVIHPKQISVVRDAFMPTAAEIRHAHVIHDALKDAKTRGSGIAVLPDGHMVDAAMSQMAKRVLSQIRDI